MDPGDPPPGRCGEYGIAGALGLPPKTADNAIQRVRRKARRARHNDQLERRAADSDRPAEPRSRPDPGPPEPRTTGRAPRRPRTAPL
ncbi:MAG TPA: hypothetical protein VNG13_14995 [Mycobacteriales bacterium]|nr:hypothetical protein [Mycobacteriales bacterium]